MSLLGAAANAEDGLRRPDNDLLDALGGDLADQSLGARRVELAQVDGVVEVVRVDDVDRDAVSCRDHVLA